MKQLLEVIQRDICTDGTGSAKAPKGKTPKEQMIIDESFKRYPLNTKRDSDGEWYDKNEYVRKAFQKGMRLGLKKGVKL